MIYQALSYYITRYLSYLTPDPWMFKNNMFVITFAQRLLGIWTLTSELSSFCVHMRTWCWIRRKNMVEVFQLHFYWNITVICWRSHIATVNISNRELITTLEYGIRLEGSPASASRDVAGVWCGWNVGWWAGDIECWGGWGELK